VRLGEAGLIAAAPWPTYDAALAEDEERVLPVQINGKRRGEIRATAGASEREVEKIVLDDPEIARRLEGLSIRRVIVVKDRIVNIVAA
jgi:leucyl-tRNA synthetase